MASIKIVLRKKKDSTGHYPVELPLAIRITRDRKAVYIYLGYKIKETDWDAHAQEIKKSYPNAKRLNALLLKKKLEANNSALEMECEKDDVSAKAVKNQIKPSIGKTFFAYARDYIHLLKEAGKYSIHSAEKSRVGYFRAFLNGQDITFSDITVPLLERFMVHLRKPNAKGRVMAERSAINYLTTIRSVFSHAIKDKSSIKKYYPFGPGKIKITFP